MNKKVNAVTKRVRVIDALQRTFQSSYCPDRTKEAAAERDGAGKRGRWLLSSAPNPETAVYDTRFIW